MARDLRKVGTNDWASRLQKVTDGQNKLPNDGEYLNGIAPGQVADDDEIRARLRKTNAEYAHFNEARMEKRATNLGGAGQFPAMASARGKFTRGFKPRYEGTLRQVSKVTGPRVTDEWQQLFDKVCVASP